MDKNHKIFYHNNKDKDHNNMIYNKDVDKSHNSNDDDGSDDDGDNMDTLD
jgi:hypothetical protein